MAFDAGSAVARYSIDLSQPKKAAAELRALFAQIKKEQDALNKVVPLPAPRTQSTTAATLAQQKLATQLQRTALTANQAAVSAQKLATEEQRTVSATANAASARDRAAQATLRLAAAQQRAAAASKNGGLGPTLPRSAESFGPQAIGQLLGITLGPQLIGQAVSSGIEAAKSALALRETKNALRAVTGDIKTYTEALVIARQQQILFGGSFQENIEGLTGLSISARQYGVDIKTLIDLSQRLSILDPSQGVKGARIALSEALSGDPTSLAKRYEIPKAALAKLRDDSIPEADRLKIIDDYLTKIGITSEAVTGKVDQDALAWRRLGAELGDVATGAGDKLATSFSGMATGLARVVGVINKNPQAIAELKALLTGKGEVTEADVTAVKTTQAENAARNVLFGTKAAADAGDTQQFDLVRDKLTALILTGEEGTVKAKQLTEAYNYNGMSLATYITYLDSYIMRSNGAGDVEEMRVRRLASLKDAADKSAFALSEQEKETLKGTIATAKLAERQAQLDKDSRAAALGLLGAGDQALILAQKYGIATDQAQFLINAQQKLTNAQALADQRKGERGGPEVNPFQGLVDANRAGVFKDIVGGVGKAATEAEKLKAKADAIADAQFSYDLSRAKTSGQRIAILQKELAGTTDQAERLRIMTQIENERNSGAKAYTGELGKQLNLEESIRDSKEKQLKATLDASASIIRDRQEGRKEDQEIRKHTNVLKHSSNPLFRAAAQDALDLIGIERQQRKLAIGEQLATAGGQIIKGKIYQGRQGGVGGSLPSAGGIPSVGGGTTTSGLPTGSGGGAGGVTVDVFVSLDGAPIAANVITRLHQGLSQSSAAGGGRAP